MEYIVWTNDQFEGWKQKLCPDQETVRAEILTAIRTGHEPLVTVAVPFQVSIKIEEGKIGETHTGKARAGKDPGAESKSEVRPGDTDPVPGVGKGRGDNRPDNSL